MEPDLSQLDAHLADAGADGYLIDADGTDSDQRYLSGFDAPDPYRTLYADGSVHLLVSGLEYGRARTESRADAVARPSEYGFRELLEDHGSHEASVRVLARWLDDHGIERVSVPERFPLAVADGLRGLGLGVSAETDGVVTEIRARKTDDEVDHIRQAQRANEAAMRRAESMLAAADVGADGHLRLDGDVLTSERVTKAIELTLLEHGCGLDETIVACGADGADPHDRGSGPLSAGELVVIDVFPRDKETKYHADMTRTFVRGEPTDEQRERYEVTLQAQEAAFEAIEPGATGADVHDAVCDVYEAAGYATLRSDEDAETGFIHGTGHGIGLDVHELPRLSFDGGELEPGHVVTVEPGLYDPAVGGVRIEDFVVVTEDGYENLVEYPKELTAG